MAEMTVGEWANWKVQARFDYPEDDEWLAKLAGESVKAMRDAVEERILADTHPGHAEDLLIALFSQVDWDDWARVLLERFPQPKSCTTIDWEFVKRMTGMNSHYEVVLDDDEVEAAQREAAEHGLELFHAELVRGQPGWYARSLREGDAT